MQAFTGVLGPRFGGSFLAKVEDIQSSICTGCLCLRAWNREAVHTLKRNGTEFATMPWELDSRELKGSGKKPVRGTEYRELVIYGHAPKMVSAQ